MPDFSGLAEVVLMTSGNVSITATGSELLEFEADDNVIGRLTSEVVWGRLELGSSGSLSSTGSITYNITADELVGVRIEGSGDIDITGLEADSFAAEVAGSGNVDPSGTGNNLVVEVDGSGEYQGEDLESRRGTVVISGSGSVVVDVTADPTVRVDGSRSVRYLGDPVVDETINGSGSVSRR